MARHELLEGIDSLVPEAEFLDRLNAGLPMRVKLGLDPTAHVVHLGWAVVLRKLRQFQEYGHTAVLIVGDFTAQVGDPSGRSETRRRLSPDEVKAYAESVLSGFRKILLPDRLEVRYNSEWLADLDMYDVLDMTSQVTVAQMLERGDFAKRFAGREPISVMEFLYPLLQAMDSVAIEADVELGGSDQLWNLMMGRVLQERHGQRPQVAMTMPLLVGTDGSQKMSQSIGNFIGIEDEPAEMFGKVMSLPDEVMEQYYRLTTDLTEKEADAIVAGLADGSLHPGEMKRRLGREITTIYHGAAAAAGAEEAFDRLFKRHEAPQDVATFELPDGDPVFLPVLLKEAGLVASSSEARRLIAQGAVRLDGDPAADLEVPRARLQDSVLQVGKRRFVRLVARGAG